MHVILYHFIEVLLEFIQFHMQLLVSDSQLFILILLEQKEAGVEGVEKVVMVEGGGGVVVV